MPCQDVRAVLAHAHPVPVAVHNKGKAVGRGVVCPLKGGGAQGSRTHYLLAENPPRKLNLPAVAVYERALPAYRHRAYVNSVHVAVYFQPVGGVARQAYSRFVQHLDHKVG